MHVNVPAVAAFREKLEAIRQGEVAKGLARLPGASPETRAAIEDLGSAITDRIFHTTTARLGDSAQHPVGEWAPVLLELFELSGSNGAVASAPG